MTIEANVLRPNQELYLEWLCTAPGERVPNSKAKFAAEVHVAEQTLRNWEKSKVFRQLWQERVDTEGAAPDKKHGLLETLYKRALDGDTRSAELWLKATNQMAPPSMKVDVSGSASQLSDDELSRLIAAAASNEMTLRVEGVTA
jgi:hypothetical protein